MPDRDALLARVRVALEPLPAVRALLESGSAAFGRLDLLSDIDLVADVADDGIGAAFDALEAELARLAPLQDRWIVPEPAWHGMSQRFYRLADTPPWLVLDVAFRPLTRRHTFTEVELHGTPRVIFDKDGAIRPTHVDPVQVAARARERVEALAARLPFTSYLAGKELRRGRLPDAMGVYWSFLVLPLCEALRLRHGPARHGFGLRYVESDLPAEAVSRLTDLLFVRDAEDLGRKAAAAEAWLADEIGALRKAGA